MLKPTDWLLGDRGRVRQEALELGVEVPSWLELDREQLTGRVMRLPARSEVQVPFDETLIVEFYSR